MAFLRNFVLLGACVRETNSSYTAGKCVTCRGVVNCTDNKKPCTIVLGVFGVHVMCYTPLCSTRSHIIRCGLINRLIEKQRHWLMEQPNGGAHKTHKKKRNTPVP